MRTRQQEIAAFTWMRPSAIALELDCDQELIREHIRAGDFPDVDGEPGAINIGSGSRPEYRVNPESFKRFRRGRKVIAA